MDGKRVKFFAGVLIAVVALVASITLIVISYNSPSCELLAKPLEPVNKTTLSNVASSDNKSLGKFAGYLKYETNTNVTADESPKIYMPLSLNSISLGELAKESQLETLTLSTDCSSIEFQLKFDKQNSRLFKVQKIQVELVHGNGKDTSCVIDEAQISLNTPGKHYACDKTRKYLCHAKSVAPKDNSTSGQVVGEKHVVATLFVEVLEFEVNGNPDVIKQGNFSTLPDLCT